MHRLRQYFVTGLLVWLPAAITAWVLLWLMGILNGIFLSVLGALEAVIPGMVTVGGQLRRVPGLGVILVTVIIFGTGVFVANMVGQWWLRRWDALMTRIPVVRSIYSSVKQVSDTLFSGSGQAFSKAVLVQFPLLRYLTPAGERRVRVDAQGQSAATRFSRLQSLDFGGTPGLPPHGALLECELLTGRTHQIRVHLAHAGHPILGDEKYGDFTLNKVLDDMHFNRMFLHAFRLTMKHPKKDDMLVLEAPMPAAFEALLARFGVDESVGGQSAFSQVTRKS